MFAKKLALIAIASSLQQCQGQVQPHLLFNRENNLRQDSSKVRMYDFSNREKVTGHLYEKQKDIKSGLRLDDEGLPVETESLIAQQFKQYDQTVDDMTLICEAELTLMRLRCNENSCDGDMQNESDRCTGCKAFFCQVDFDIQKKDPEKNPSFMDVVGESEHCNSVLIQKDFNEVVQECREYDRQKQRNGIENNLPKLLPLSGIIADTGSADSEAVTNSLISMDAAVRVLVEPQPIHEAMTVCDDYIKRRRKKFRGILESSICNRKKASRLMEDVIYLLSRTRDINEEKLVIKLDPEAILGIDMFDSSYPDVDWMYIYNDPTEAIAEELGKGRPERAQCVKTRKDPPPALIDVVKESGLEVESLSLAEFCAATYAVLAKKALTEQAATHKGTFVNVEEALNVLPGFLENKFHLPVPKGLDEMKKFVNKQPTRSFSAQKSHMERVKVVAPDLFSASAAIYGPIYKELENLQNGNN